MQRARDLMMILPLCTAPLLWGCGSERIEEFQAFLAKRHETAWRGHRVNVGPDYVLLVKDDTLKVMRSTDAPEGWFRKALVFANPNVAEQATEGKQWCASHPEKCRAIVGGPPRNIDCIGLGAISDGDSSGASIVHCWSAQSNVGARFACYSSECRELLGIVNHVLSGTNTATGEGSRKSPHE